MMGRKRIYENRKEFMKEWEAKNYYSFRVRFPKEMETDIKAYTETIGMSNNAFVVLAVERYMKTIYDESDETTRSEIDEALAKAQKRKE